MTRKPVNERQLEVLRWIGDGCPPHDWPDQTHKTTASALQGRRLVTVTRHQGAWSATITDDGQHFLEHGRYPPQPDQTRGRPTAIRRQAARRDRRPESEIANLVARLQEAGGTLRVVDPDTELRAAYRRAISAAITSGWIPDGMRLRHTGRDRGDLTIQLVNVDGLPKPRERPPPVAVPDALNSSHPVVADLAKRDDLGVLDAQRSRALRIVQGIVDEALRRGYSITPREDDRFGVQIGIGEDGFELTLFEELETVDECPEDEIDAARYPWQRVRSHKTKAPSGRLVLQLDDRFRPPWWADRKRWSLVDKLPEMFTLIEERARHAQQKRDRQSAEQQERRRQWEAAVPEARRRYLDDLNRTRIVSQADAWQRAGQLRAYAAALRTHAESLRDSHDGAQARVWADWAVEIADRLDPLHSPDELRAAVPDEIPAEELDRYMPTGMTVRHPPDKPSW